METLEGIYEVLLESGVALELIAGWDSENEFHYGVRFRTFGRNVPKNKMILGSGVDFVEAANDAWAKAQAGRWESLDWAARPWTQRQGGKSLAHIGF